MDVSYNWPYDFFSLVELAKIESEVEFSEREIKEDEKPRKTIKPKVNKKLTRKLKFGGRKDGKKIRKIKKDLQGFAGQTTKGLTTINTIGDT